jgi:hypothetical protein
MPDKPDFETTFNELKKILAPYQAKLNVIADKPDRYELETNHVMKNKHRMYFGGVRRGKNYVSFHLMPIYGLPDLRAKISPELRKRMQGKSCFNFTSVDEKLFKELRQLTKEGFARFTSKEFYSQF